MQHDTDFRKNLTAKEISDLFRYELERAKRPANEVVLVDEDVMQTLKICKRQLQYMKSRQMIPHSQLGKRSYYLLSDVLALLESNRQDAIFTKRKI